MARPDHDSYASGGASGDGGERMPPAVRRTLLAGLGVLAAGALYLIAVRGPALLLDLAGMSALFCL